MSCVLVAVRAHTQISNHIYNTQQHKHTMASMMANASSRMNSSKLGRSRHGAFCPCPSCSGSGRRVFLSNNRPRAINWPKLDEVLFTFGGDKSGQKASASNNGTTMCVVCLCVQRCIAPACCGVCWLCLHACLHQLNEPSPAIPTHPYQVPLLCSASSGCANCVKTITQECLLVCHMWFGPGPSFSTTSHTHKHAHTSGTHAHAALWKC